MDLMNNLPMMQALMQHQQGRPMFGGQNWQNMMQPGSDFRSTHPRVDQFLTSNPNWQPGDGRPGNTGGVPPNMGIAVGEQNPSAPRPSPPTFGGGMPNPMTVPLGMGSNASQGRPMAAPALPMQRRPIPSAPR